MGSYKYLLIVFAVFDIVYSITEWLTPIAVINTGYGFVTFITDGPFFENVIYGQHAVSSRCTFISLSYALLIIHFVYRYLLLFSPELVHYFFEALGITISLVYFLFHGITWTLICDCGLAANEEIRNITRRAFLEEYNVDSNDVGMLTGQYMNASSYVVWKSWLGIGTLTIFSTYCMCVYFILGYKIVTKIGKNCNMSKISLQLHRQLFKALVVQTCIPIVASFLPTTIAWYAPIFGLNLTWWNNYICIIALASFPFIDPIAVICFIPSYKNALLKALHLYKKLGRVAASSVSETQPSSRRTNETSRAK